MKSDVPYLVLLKDSINQIFTYIGETEKEDFLETDLLKDACLVRLIVMGECAGKISQVTRDRFPEVEWQLMKAPEIFTYMFMRKLIGRGCEIQ